ncbi:MAG: AAA family ATPase [Clostridiales bacterium]|nr:MAG: AAA family ATPase [Clostridiales bacterium]
MAEGSVPERLVGAQVYLLEMSSIVAGTQYRGQFESRIKKALSRRQKSDNVILVIDEIHSIVSAGDADGAMNAGNIFKTGARKGRYSDYRRNNADRIPKNILKKTRRLSEDFRLL